MAARCRVPSAVQAGLLRERKNARGVGDAVALDDDAAVVNGVVRKENRFQHFRRGFAIHADAQDSTASWS